MATTLEELEIKFTAQFGGLQSQLNGVKQQVDAFSARTQRAGSALAGIGRMMKFYLGTVAAKALGGLAQNSLQMANTAVESENLFEESMRGMASAARTWSDELRDTLGLNAYALRKNAGTMNVMLRSMGFGEKKAYDMATGLTMLAEDMASFYNLSSEEAFNKIQSGITGMAMPLKQLGILVDDQTIKQYALKTGIKTTGGEMSQQEKVLARYAALMDQTATAQGDLARTISSPANQLRVLSNTLDQAKVALGTAFQPIQTAVMPLLNSLASAAMTAAQAVSYFISSLTGFTGVNVFAAFAASKSAGAQKDLSKSLDKTAKSLKGAGGAAKKASKDAKVGLKAFDEINKLTEKKAKSGGGGGGGAKPLDETGSELDEAEKQATALERVSEKVKQIAERIKQFWEGLKTSLAAKLVVTGWDTLKWLITDVLSPLGAWCTEHAQFVGDALGALAIAIGTFKISRALPGLMAAFKSGLVNIGAAIAAHPALAVASGVAAGIIVITNAINRARDQAASNELARRFGTVSLSVEELRTMLGKVETPFTQSANKIAAGLREMTDAAASFNSLDNTNRKLLLSYTLTPNPQVDWNQLQESIQKQVDEGTAALENGHLTAAANIHLAFGDSTEGEELLGITNNSWETIKGQYQAKAEELLSVLGGRLGEGMSAAEKAKAADKIMQDMAEIISSCDPEKIMAEQKIHVAAYEFANGKLTPESYANFSKVLDELGADLTEKSVMPLEIQSALDIKAAIDAGKTDAEIERIKEIWAKRIADEKLKTQLFVEEMRISGVVEALTNSFPEAVQAGVDMAQVMSRDYVTEAMQALLDDGFSAEYLKTDEGKKNIAIVANGMMTEAMQSVEMPDGATRDAVNKMLESLRPGIDGMKDLAAEYEAQGKEIPESLARALGQVEALEAAGKGITETLIAAVPDAEEFGGQFENAGMTHLQKYVDGANSVSPMVQAANKAIGEAGMASLKSALDSGKLSKADYDRILLAAPKGSLASLAAEFLSAGNNAAAGFANAIASESNIRKAKEAAKRIADAAAARLRQSLQIHSPSRVTGWVGDMFALGFENSIMDGAAGVQEAAGKMGLAAVDGVSGVEKELAAVMPSPLVASGNVRVESDGGFQSAIESGIARGVEKVMDLLQIRLDVDGAELGRVVVGSLRNMERKTGRPLLATR